jgi:two-component system sensor histidine kinase PilS (NtrC family)
MADSPAIITDPSKAPADVQNLTLFRVYCIYRILLSILLLLSYFTADTRQLVATLNPHMYLYVGIGYLLLNLGLLGLMSSRYAGNQPLLFAVFFADILALTLMSDASGGVDSGLPILLIVSTAASAILINSATIATLIAALAVIAILADTIRLISEQVLGLGSLFPAGLLGILIFAVSLMIQVIARRVRRAEALARKRASDLYNLQRLNEQIVQQLQTGILMVYDNGSVRVMNHAATRLLDPERPVPLEQGRSLADYNEQLAEQYGQWVINGHHTPRPIDIGSDAPQVIANFRKLREGSTSDTLVFVEDYSPVTQHAQSLKLASLGRLTASIAHEIRNPLGAVSHAAQLLGESEELPAGDRRMAEIIQHHAQRMNSIIESVMQISRRKPPEPRALTLRKWLQDYVTDYCSTRTDTPRIQFSSGGESCTVNFDPEHLRRVMSNLLDNALRHSKTDAGINSAEVRLAQEHLSQRCVIDVIDQGKGVPESEQAKLFEPFYTTAEQGTGLGLYLCRELCEINNATLVYRKTEQGESCFRLAMTLRS